MKNLNIPVGISDFERIRELNYYYVDKTGLIKTLLQGEMIPEEYVVNFVEEHQIGRAHV